MRVFFLGEYLLISCKIHCIFIWLKNKTMEESRHFYSVIMRIFRLVISSALAVYIVFIVAHNLGFRSPIMALSSVGCALGVVVANMSTVCWSIPKALAPVRSWETSGRVYELLGVYIYGAFLRRPPLRYFNTSVYVKSRRADLPNVYVSIMRAEAAHFWAFTITSPIMVYELMNQWWDGLGWFLLFHAFFNIYPGLHLRHIRARIETVIRRKPRP
jgi:hypothetical protein